jgi:hypothetical protein
MTPPSGASIIDGYGLGTNGADGVNGGAAPTNMIC